MSTSDHADVSVQVRGYLMVFGTLMVLTIVTVAASYLNLPVGPTVALGLTIAAVKASLVGAFFMHLRHEKAWIYGALSLTAVLAVALFSFTLWTEADHAPGTQFAAPFSAPAAADAPAEGAH